MANISLPHLLVFVLIVVLLFGTAKLKNVGKDIGTAIKEFKASVRDQDSKNPDEKPKS